MPCSSCRVLARSGLSPHRGTQQQEGLEGLTPIPGRLHWQQKRPDQDGSSHLLFITARSFLPRSPQFEGSSLEEKIKKMTGVSQKGTSSFLRKDMQIC